MVNVKLIFTEFYTAFGYFMIKIEQNDEIFPNDKTISHHWSLIAKPSISVSLLKGIDTVSIAKRE